MDEARLKELLDAQFASFFGQMSQHFDKRFNELEAKVDSKADAAQLDRVYNAIDGIAKRLTTEEEERAAIKSQLDRHEGWIQRLATKVGLRLSHN